MLHARCCNDRRVRRIAVAGRRAGRDAAKPTAEVPMLIPVRAWSRVLLIPLACSFAPWLFFAAVVARSANSSDLEGALYYAGFLGAASFAATGPVAATCLLLAPRDRSLGLGTYLALYFAIGVPTIAYQAIAQSSSVLTAFVPGSLLLSNTLRTAVETALLGVVIYAAWALILRFLSHVSESATAVTAFLLCVATLLGVFMKA
jgi:hypothetical protein